MQKAIWKTLSWYFVIFCSVGGSMLGVHLSGYELDMPSWWIGFLSANCAIFLATYALRWIDAD